MFQRNYLFCIPKKNWGIEFYKDCNKNVVSVESYIGQNWVNIYTKAKPYRTFLYVEIN